jgi:hypothetical protein
MIHTATNAAASVATISQGVKPLVSSSKTKIDPLIGALKALLVCRFHNSVKQADPLAWLPQEERHRVRQRQGSLTPDFIMQSVAFMWSTFSAKPSLGPAKQLHQWITQARSSNHYLSVRW